MATVALSSIAKSFGSTKVLGGVDLDIADGEFLTLVGPSGCGKSTLIRIIAGLEHQDGGSVAIESEPGCGTTITCIFPIQPPQDRVAAA